MNRQRLSHYDDVNSTDKTGTVVKKQTDAAKFINVAISLPSTGGTGNIMLFYVLGSLLLMGSILILMFAAKKAR